MSTNATINRIDPKTVPGLFGKHPGCRPIRNRFFARRHGKVCCCINTILAIEAVGESRAIKRARHLFAYRNIPQIARLSGLETDYALGLALGWDSGAAEDSPAAALDVNDPAVYLLGFSDGKAAWEACQKGGRP